MLCFLSLQYRIVLFAVFCQAGPPRGIDCLAQKRKMALSLSPVHSDMLPHR